MATPASKDNLGVGYVGRILMINPPYPHFTPDLIGVFERDPLATLPIGLMYAGELTERNGNEVSYFDCQLHDLEQARLDNYDAFGITVMGPQNTTPAHYVFTHLVKEKGIDPSKIFLGGQGIERVPLQDFQRIFPHANLVARNDSMDGYWDISLERQMEKFPESDLRTYLSNEVTLLFSQGCRYACDFCAAVKNRTERFFNTKDNLDAIVRKAKDFGMAELSFYATSLDFFQQALWPKRGHMEEVARRLESIIDIRERYGVRLRVRALTRYDSYNRAMESEELKNLALRAGFHRFGFGIDGIASMEMLNATKKRISTSRGKPREQLLRAMEHCHGHFEAVEGLLVVGTKGATERALNDENRMIREFLVSFPNFYIRFFPSKNAIAGNENWIDLRNSDPEAHGKLLADPQRFLDLGYETFANRISHPDERLRKMVNHSVISMSEAAHALGRLDSFLTIPHMETDGHELMDPQHFSRYKEFMRQFVPEVTKTLTLKNLPLKRFQVNRVIPRDK